MLLRPVGDHSVSGSQCPVRPRNSAEAPIAPFWHRKTSSCIDFGRPHQPHSQFSSRLENARRCAQAWSHGRLHRPNRPGPHIPWKNPRPTGLPWPLCPPPFSPVGTSRSPNAKFRQPPQTSHYAHRGGRRPRVRLGASCPRKGHVGRHSRSVGMLPQDGHRRARSSFHSQVLCLPLTGTAHTGAEGRPPRIQGNPLGGRGNRAMFKGREAI